MPKTKPETRKFTLELTEDEVVVLRCVMPRSIDPLQNGWPFTELAAPSLSLDSLRRKLEAVTWTRHVTRIDLDLESVRRGGSGRFAACTCEWHGPDRATLAMAADDTMIHESGGTTSLSEVPLSDEPVA